MSFAESDLQAALSRFCQEAFGLRHATALNLTKLAQGWESDIYSFALEREAGEPRPEELILRVYPGGEAAEKSAREFKVMKRLHGLGYPVPAILAFEPTGSALGDPILIMQKVEGRALSSVLLESPIGRKRELIGRFCQMLVDLHALDWQPFVPDLLPHQPAKSIAAWLLWARERLRQLAGTDFEPVVDWLLERSVEVGEAQLSLTHGDYHTKNVLCPTDRAAFVIDWTQADVIDFRFDLAWTLLLMGMFDGWAMREAILRDYERLAGRRVEHIEYFEVIASLRRLFSIVASLAGGAGSVGLRPGAEAEMRGNQRHIESVYGLLSYRTGITIPPVERLLTEL